MQTLRGWSLSIIETIIRIHAGVSVLIVSPLIASSGAKSANKSLIIFSKKISLPFIILPFHNAFDPFLALVYSQDISLEHFPIEHFPFPSELFHFRYWLIFHYFRTLGIILPEVVDTLSLYIWSSSILCPVPDSVEKELQGVSKKVYTSKISAVLDSSKDLWKHSVFRSSLGPSGTSKNKIISKTKLLLKVACY